MDAPDESAGAGPLIEQAFLDQRLQGLAQRDAGDVEPKGQLALGRQRLFRAERALADQTAQMTGELQIERHGAVRRQRPAIEQPVRGHHRSPAARRASRTAPSIASPSALASTWRAGASSQPSSTGP